jgi:uncharacterized protein (DUF2236 family)
MTDHDAPQEVRDALCLLGLLAGGANVVMQLARLPIGYGVANSTVDSGRADKHPLKRGRTTSAFLVIALFGTEHERLAMRAEIAKAHRFVHSQPGDPVQYDAFDPELQLWVAACLYQGALDVYTRLHGPPAADRIEPLYQHAKRLGTTLQVTDEMWPATAAEFDAYWQAGLERIEMDELTRTYLTSVADFTFLLNPLGRFAAPIKWLVRPLGSLITGGFLPQRFRDELGLAWNDRRQRRFDRFIAIAGALTRSLPRALREFPLNVYLWDTRRRIRLELPVV